MERVGIFWDYENCRIPTNVSGYTVAGKIRDAAQGLGQISVFKAYLDVSLESPLKLAKLQSELQCSGVSLIHCPHNSKKEVADKMLMVDMILFALENPSQIPTTIILITGDKDFVYAVSALRLRKHPVIIIHPTQNIQECLMYQATAFFYWREDIIDNPDPCSRVRDKLTKSGYVPSSLNSSSETLVSGRGSSEDTFVFVDDSENSQPLPRIAPPSPKSNVCEARYSPIVQPQEGGSVPFILGSWSGESKIVTEENTWLVDSVGNKEPQLLESPSPITFQDKPLAPAKVDFTDTIEEWDLLGSKSPSTETSTVSPEDECNDTAPLTKVEIDSVDIVAMRTVMSPSPVSSCCHDSGSETLGTSCAVLSDKGDSQEDGEKCSGASSSTSGSPVGLIEEVSSPEVMILDLLGERPDERTGPYTILPETPAPKEPSKPSLPANCTPSVLRRFSVLIDVLWTESQQGRNKTTYHQLVGLLKDAHKFVHEMAGSGGVKKYLEQARQVGLVVTHGALAMPSSTVSLLPSLARIPLAKLVEDDGYPCNEMYLPLVDILKSHPPKSSLTFTESQLTDLLQSKHPGLLKKASVCTYKQYLALAEKAGLLRKKSNSVELVRWRKNRKVLSEWRIVEQSAGSLVSVNVNANTAVKPVKRSSRSETDGKQGLFKPLVDELSKLERKGEKWVSCSELAQVKAMKDPRVYEKVGVSRLHQYIELARNKGLVGVKTTNGINYVRRK